MTRVLFCSICILMFLATTAKCQEEDEDSGSGAWDKLAEIWRNFYNTVSETFKNAWRDFTTEVRERFTDFRGWTREAWDSFKAKMNEWVDERSDINEDEKSEMRKYIERLQMPEEEENGENKKK